MKHHQNPLAQLLSLLLIAMVLFSRLAIAGYVCPPEAGTMANPSTMVVSVVNCQDMDEAQPALAGERDEPRLEIEPVRIPVDLDRAA